MTAIRPQRDGNAVSLRDAGRHFEKSFTFFQKGIDFCMQIWYHI